MARGNGSRVDRITLDIPAELNQLIELYKVKVRQVSTTAVLRNLLETHPAITSLASDLIQLHQEGTTPANPERSKHGTGNSPVASLFLGYVCGGQVSYSWRDNAFRRFPGGAGTRRYYGGLTNGSFYTANRAA